EREREREGAREGERERERDGKVEGQRNAETRSMREGEMRERGEGKGGRAGALIPPIFLTLSFFYFSSSISPLSLFVSIHLSLLPCLLTHIVSLTSPTPPSLPPLLLSHPSLSPT